MKKIILGCENFLSDYLELIKGKRVGLITNPTGIDSQFNSLIDLFYANSHIDLVALYGPEHGINGHSQAGVYVPFSRDKKYGLPIFSLYGQSLEATPGKLKNADEQMRSFDTAETGKLLEDSMIENVDAMIFDIQDIGTRIYTYAATMAFSMQICAENSMDFIVLDRPNPINGKDVEGPVLDYPECSSFVGLYPIPVRHGMTIGELARLFNARYLSKKANLTVIPMEKWTRNMWYDQTGLPWIIPSPNIPSLRTAMVYPGQVFLEGTNVSEGRGTTRPFELFGAPWIVGQRLVKDLNMIGLPGVKFRDARFTPNYSKFKDQLCRGAQIHVHDRETFLPFYTALHVIKTVREMYPKQFQFHAEYFDKLAGTPSLRKAIEKEIRAEEIMSAYDTRLDEFKKLRKEYFLY